MEELVINVVNQFGYFGILILIMLENIFPPIPSVAILSFCGFMTTVPNSELNLVGVIVFSTIGSVLGSLVLYYVGKLLNKEKLKKIVSSKYGKMLMIKPKDIEKADYWFDTKGGKTVLICRFIPVVRALISLPAGMSEMPILKFLLYTTIGSFIWGTFVVILGSMVGESWSSLVNIFEKTSYFIFIILCLLLISALTIFYINRRRKRK